MSTEIHIPIAKIEYKNKKQTHISKSANRHKFLAPISLHRSRLLGLSMIGALAISAFPQEGNAAFNELTDAKAACIASELKDELVEKFPGSEPISRIEHMPKSTEPVIIVNTKKPDRASVAFFEVGFEHDVKTTPSSEIFSNKSFGSATAKASPTDNCSSKCYF